MLPQTDAALTLQKHSDICWYVVVQGATIHTSQGLLMRLQPRCKQGQAQSLCQVRDDSKHTARLEEELATMSSVV